MKKEEPKPQPNDAAAEPKQEEWNEEVLDIQKPKPFWVTRTMSDDFSRSDVLTAILREGTLYTFFVVAVILSTEGKKDPSLFYLTKAIERQFIEKTFVTYNGQAIDFPSISSSADFWMYTKTSLLDSLYWEHYYDTVNPVAPTPKDDRGVLYENKILGVARIRQVRVRDDSCKVQKYFKKMIEKCYADYEEEAEDKSSFGKKSGTAWTYNTKKETKSIDYSGNYANYHGGGFYQDLSETRNGTLEMIDDLYKNLWITRGTRAIFIDFSMFNPNLNLVIVCKLVFEFPPTGGVVPSWKFNAIILNSGIHSDKMVHVAFEYIVYFYLLFFIAEEIREVIYFKFKYLWSFWAYIDLINIGLVCANFFTAFVLLPNSNKMLQELADHQDEYGNLEELARIKHINTDICAILLFFTIVKVFKYLNFNKTMGQINNTLKRCMWDLVCFICMFMIIFAAFAVLGHLLFGSQVKDFSTFGDTMFTLLRTILGDFDYGAIEKSDRVMAPIFFISFIFFVFFILLNMFLAIINDTYADVKTEIAIAPEEMTLTEFVTDNIFKCLKFCKINIRRKGHKKEANVTIREIREAFKKCGFSDLEIEMFFARFNVDPLATVVQYDTNKIMKELEMLNTGVGKTDDNVYVQLNDFLEQQERLDRIENSINTLVKKLEALVARMKQLENERKNKANKG